MQNIPAAAAAKGLLLFSFPLSLSAHLSCWVASSSSSLVIAFLSPPPPLLPFSGEWAIPLSSPSVLGHSLLCLLHGRLLAFDWLGTLVSSQ